MKMSDNFKQIIALLLAYDMHFNLDFGDDECYYLIKKDESGRLIWEIDDENKDNGYKIMFWDKEYSPRFFHVPIDYILKARTEEKYFNLKGK